MTGRRKICRVAGELSPTPNIAACEPHVLGWKEILSSAFAASPSLLKGITKGDGVRANRSHGFQNQQRNSRFVSWACTIDSGGVRLALTPRNKNHQATVAVPSVEDPGAYGQRATINRFDTCILVWHDVGHDSRPTTLLESCLSQSNQNQNEETSWQHTGNTLAHTTSNGMAPVEAPHSEQKIIAIPPCPKFDKRFR